MQYSNPHIGYCLEDPSSIFSSLHNRDKEVIDRNHSTVTVKKGDFIYSAGEKTKGVICLVSGKFKIYRIGAGGREQILKLIKPSELSGYRNLFQNTTWQDSAVAIEDSVVCVLEKQSLISILRDNHELSFKMLKLLTEELAFSQDRIISLTQKHVRARLVETLLMMSEIYGFEADGNTINASLSRDDIAHHSNMTTSNAIRTLSNLATEGKIEIKRRKIRLMDITALETISNVG
jgi:CRP-like cAMP-binding protein